MNARVRPSRPRRLAAPVLAAGATAAVLAAALLPAAPPARGDDETEKADDAEKSEDPARALGVRLDDVSGLKTALERVDAAIADGDWDRAGVLLQRAAAEHRGAVAVDPDDRYAYQPAGRIIRRRLAALPTEGVAAFGRRFAPEAARALERALEQDGTAELRRVADLYFPTESAARALFEAAGRHLERGDHARALSLWEELFTLHAHPVWTRRAALAALALRTADGPPSAAEELAARILERGLGAHRVSWRGGTATVQEVTAELLAQARVRPVTAATADRIVGTSGGLEAPSRTVVGVPAKAKQTEKLWRVPLPAVPSRLAGKFQPRMLVAADHGVVVVHLGKSLFVYSLHDGADRWAINGYGGLPEYFDALASAGPQPPFGLARSRGTLFATFAPDPVGAGPNGGRFVFGAGAAAPEIDPASAKIIAIDLRTGKRLWRRSLDDVENGLVAVGAPVPISGGAVAVAAIAAGAPEESWLVALDAHDGSVRWKRFLAAALPERTNPQGANGVVIRGRVVINGVVQSLGGGARPAPTISARGDAIAFATNAGVYGVVDAADGEVVWLRTYEAASSQKKPADIRGVLRRRARRVPRNFQQVEQADADDGAEHSPPLWLGRRVLFALSDVEDLLLVDADDGRIYAKSFGRRGGHLVGTVDGQVLVAGEKGLQGYNADGLKLRWVFPENGARRDDEELDLAGDPTVAGSLLLVPSEGGVLAFGLDGSGPRTLLSWSTAHDQAGDLAVTGKMLLSLGSRDLHAFPLDD